MTNPESKSATSISDELDQLGDEHFISRNEDESDEAYADRIIFELDVHVEELWEHQDKIRALIQNGNVGAEPEPDPQ